MSFGGPIDSMIQSHKSNLRQLHKRKRLKEIQDEYSAEPKAPLRFKEGQFEEMRRFKEHIRKDRHRDQFRVMMIVGATLIVMMIILYWVITTDYSGIIDVIE